MEINPIAVFKSPFKSKFGIPKQSGLVAELRGEIQFEPGFRSPDFLRGIEGFDFLWLVWQFSANAHASNSSVVRPPVLGGNEKVGVFATRSPFRPNPIGLSSVRLESVEWNTPVGPVLHVLGADLMDGTPIFDIKPYVEYSDAHVDVRSGFTGVDKIERLEVVIPENVERCFSIDELAALRSVLALDPRPHYHRQPDRIYGFPFAGRDVRFRVVGRCCQVVDAVVCPNNK